MNRSIYMHKQIADVFLDGFTSHSAKEGEPVDLIVRGFATSDSAVFFIYAESIANLLFPKLQVSMDGVNRYLMILHEDATSDVYVEDFRADMGIRVSRPVEAGGIVRRTDVASIEDVQFPDVSMAKGDRLVYFDRRGWRFGVAFDLSRRCDAASFGALCAQLQTRLALEDILQLTLAEFHRAEESGFDAFIITEGKTDWRHLERALSELGYRGRLGYDRSDQDRGDTRLLETCRSLALEPRDRPVICVFDRDNDQVLKELAAADPKGKGYQDWGNNVFSFALPVPSHREAYSNISIEMYYTDEILARVTSDGRRLCFDNEVKQEILPGRARRVVLIPPVSDLEATKKVVAKDVDAIEGEGGRKVGLSKARFAELVRTRSDPFSDVDISAFRLVATQIGRVLAASRQASP